MFHTCGKRRNAATTPVVTPDAHLVAGRPDALEAPRPPSEAGNLAPTFGGQKRALSGPRLPTSTPVLTRPSSDLNWFSHPPAVQRVVVVGHRGDPRSAARDRTSWARVLHNRGGEKWSAARFPRGRPWLLIGTGTLYASRQRGRAPTTRLDHPVDPDRSGHERVCSSTPRPNRRGWPREPKEAPGEADVSAEQTKTSQKARVPASHVDPGRTIDHQEPSTQGPTAARRLTWRVTDRSTLVRLGRGGRRSRRGPVTVWYLPAESPDHARFAWAIGRKVGGAVVRNRLRRQLRAIVESEERSSGLARGAYLVSLAPSGAGRSYEELKENVEAALRAVSSGSGPEDTASTGAPVPPATPGVSR